MHCPRCGADALVGQQFCRSCGFNLEKVAELLGEQLPAAPDTNLALVHQRQRQLEHWAGIAGLGILLLVVFLLIYLVVTEMMIKSGKIGVGLLLLLLFVGGGVAAALQGYAKALKQRLATQAPAATPEIPDPEIRQLDSHHDPAQSVTEQTTELLNFQPARHTTKEV